MNKSYKDLQLDFGCGDDIPPRPFLEAAGKCIKFPLTHAQVLNADRTASALMGNLFNEPYEISDRKLALYKKVEEYFSNDQSYESNNQFHTRRKALWDWAMRNGYSRIDVNLAKKTISSQRN